MRYVKIDTFLRVVNQGDFVEAHEVLEEDWKRLKKEGRAIEAKFIQALINGATALALWKKNRPEASLRVWETFQKNKSLLKSEPIDSLSNNESYHFACKLLEYKFSQKERKEPLDPRFASFG